MEKEDFPTIGKSSNHWKNAKREKYDA